MYKWLKQCQLELKLFTRHWYLFLIPILFAIWFVHDVSMVWTYAKESAGPSQDIFYYAYHFHQIKGTLTLGIAFFVGILMVRRDTVHPAYEWINTLPVSNLVFMSVKYIIGLLYLSLFTLFIMGSYVVLALMREVNALTVIHETLFFAIQYELSYAVSLALAMFLAVTIKNRLVYLIGFCAWIFGTFFLDVFLISRMNLYYLKTFHLNQFFSATSDLMSNEAWGLALINKEMLYSHLFVISFIVLLLTVMVWLLKRWTPSRTRKVWAMASIVVLMLSVLCYFPYGKLWYQRYHRLHDIEQKVPYFSERGNGQYNISWITDNVSKPYHYTMFHISKYKINLRKSTNNQLNSNVTLTLPTSGLKGMTSIPFTLNRTFKLSSVTMNGERVKWTQAKDFITIKQPADLTRDSQKITFNYSGKVMFWSTMDRSETYLGFVTGEEMFLPSNIAWYPIPGHQYLYEKLPGPHSRLQEARVDLGHEPITYDVSIKGVQHPIYAPIKKKEATSDEQRFMGISRDGVDLFSGQLITIKGKKSGITIITTPANRIEARQFLDDNGIEKAMAYYKSWLGDINRGVSKVFYYPMQFFMGTDIWWNHHIVNDSVYVSETQNSNLDPYKANDILKTMLFGNYTNSYGENTVAPALQDAMLYVYEREVLHRSKHQSLNQSFVMSETSKNDPMYKNSIVAKQIDQAIDQGKMDSVKHMLAYFYKKGALNETPNSQMNDAKVSYDEWKKEWQKVMGNE